MIQLVIQFNDDQNTEKKKKKKKKKQKILGMVKKMMYELIIKGNVI